MGGSLQPAQFFLTILIVIIIFIPNDSMKMRNKILVVSAVISIGLLIFITQNEGTIKEVDACLCTEILNNESFLKNQNKMPSVKKCIDKFKGFNNAHLKCIKSFDFDHPEIKMDSLKSI